MTALQSLFARHAWLLLGVPIGLLTILAAATMPTFTTGAYQDDAWYLATASAIADGLGYVRPWTPTMMPETYLPVGYPLMLAPVMWLFPHSFAAAMYFSLACMIVTVFASWRYYRLRTKGWVPLLLVTAFSVNPGVVRFATVAMSEALFMVAVMIILVLGEVRLTGNDVRRRDCVLLGALAAVAMLIRAWGVALVAAIVVQRLLRRDWRGAIVAGLPCALVLAVQTARNASVGGAGAVYGISPSTAGSFFDRIPRSSLLDVPLAWSHEISKQLVPVLGDGLLARLGVVGQSWVYVLIVATIVGLLLLGFAEEARSRIAASEPFVAIYCGIMMVAWLDSRYPLPLLPLLLLYLFRGATTVVGSVSRIRSIRPELQARLATVMLGALIVLAMVKTRQAIAQPVNQTIPDVALGPTWLRSHAEPHDVVMATVPRLSYLYSGLTTVPFPNLAGEVYDAYSGFEHRDQAAAMDAALRKWSVRYILVEPELVISKDASWPATLRDEVMPYLLRHPERFEEAFVSEDGLVRVYRVLNVRTTS